MFNMSIYDNLALINANKEMIIDVCKKVHIHDFIMSLPNGYDTIIKEGSIDFSGGQKQRLSIARTLLKKSEIILLDEITSALNKKLSDEIFDLLHELKKEHTILVITHKDEEANKCDNVFELNNGIFAKVK
jgi:ABC-type bacteriocin/lantibiotic exporters, contain an N-terminal double-glycine peptidase domain